MKTRSFLGAMIAIAFAQAFFSCAAGTPSTKRHVLRMDDVLNLQGLDRASLSPDGQWAAIVVQRPARDGEVYGRTAYEIDPGRSDIWLVSTRDGEKRAITHGQAQAAGSWCATWSPDGQRLAFLSTQPEHGEPRGGDNVRLYMWERATGTILRMLPDAVMTQTRYGGALHKLDLRGGADQGTIAHGCSDGQENAPFLWLDDHRLLVVTLPQGQVSGLIDQYGRPFRVAEQDAKALHDGSRPTGRDVSSGSARSAAEDSAGRAVLRIVDAVRAAGGVVAELPAYPFRGALTVSVAPGGKTLAVLATVGALAPAAGQRFPNAGDDSWTVERRLGFIDLAPGSELRWVTLPSVARYPLALDEWSPDARHVALRGRASGFTHSLGLFAVSAETGRATPLGPSDMLTPGPILWANDRQLAARLAGSRADLPEDWWLFGLDGAAVRVGSPIGAIPTSLQRGPAGQLVGLAGEQLLRLDVARQAFLPIARIAGKPKLAWPLDTGKAIGKLLIARDGPGTSKILQMFSMDGRAGGSVEPAGATLLDADLDQARLLSSEASTKGISLQTASLADRTTRRLFQLNGFMEDIAWGSKRSIDYTGADGKPLRAAVILPPDYVEGCRYPALTWVYQGYRVGPLETDYFLDPFLPGIYNLQLYAARGYVVLIPSMPLPAGSDPTDAYSEMAGNVVPAVDRLVALGIADPDRIGVFGQSRGGYAVNALLGQTDRFKAGVALASISDLAGYFGQFDPTARGYPGIEHEKSDNWAEVAQFGLDRPPAQALTDYERISPLTYVDKVQAPLLIIHGDYDIRGSSAQAEQFFSGLYAAGKTARLVRYGGESHSLAQSPTNIRDIYSRTIDWFDTYLAAGAAQASGTAHSGEKGSKCPSAAPAGRSAASPAGD